MRELFEHELAVIQDLIIEMATRASTAMSTATQAMLDADLESAQSVIDADDVLDDLTGRVERACYDAVARQQPVARDLRLVVSAMQVSSSLERMGDLADHVARLTQLRYPRASIPEDVRPMFIRMGTVADQMSTLTGELLRTRDLSVASRILAMDDEMDHVHHELFTAVLSPTWTHGVEAAIDTTLLSRYYERYADHCVAVARRVIQFITGVPFSQAGVAGQSAGDPVSHPGL